MTLPLRKELLRGVLAADLIAFHTFEYVRHFMHSVAVRLELMQPPASMCLPLTRLSSTLTAAARGGPSHDAGG